MTTETVDMAGARVALPAPAWIGLVTALLAGFVAPWRRTPLTALPAALAVIPWLPLPIPAAGLLWTGHLAWAPLAFAGIAAGLTAVIGVSAPESAHGVTDRFVGRSRPVAAAVLAGLLTLAAGLLVLGSLGHRLPGGDEPHYLIIAQSLLEDGDLRIENQHALRQYATWWPGTLPPHYIARGQDDGIYSIHAPGVAVLVAPLFSLAGLAGAQATILLLAAVSGASTWMLGWLTTRSKSAAWFAWAAIAMSATMLVQSVTIFPDGPGAAFTAASAVIWIGFRQRRIEGLRWLVLAGLLLAALPFLHTRFVVIAAALGILFVADLAVRPGDGRWRPLLAFSLAPLIGAIGWFAYFHLIYGAPDPTAPYGPNPESSFTYVPGGMLGLLADQQFGLLTVSPVLILAIVGWWHAGRQRTGAAAVSLRLLPVVVLYLATVATYWMWWAGVPATPARFATAVLPLLAVPLAHVWASGAAFMRSLAVTLLTLTAGMSVLLLGSGGEFTWAVRGGRAEWLDALGSTADLARAWPSFFWKVLGGEVATEWPFALHTVVTVGVVWAVTSIAGWTGRRVTLPSVPIVAGTLVVAVSLTVAAPVGWALNDVTGLRPAASQLRVLKAAARGDRVVSLAPLSVRRVDRRVLPLVVTVPSIALPTEPLAQWGALTDVPAGHYTLRITSPQPAGGHLGVHLWSPGGEASIVNEMLVPQSRHLVEIDLPHDVPIVRFEVGNPLALPGTRIDLIPGGDHRRD